MPKLSPRSIAHDAGRTLLLAVHGKAKYLLELDDAMGVRIVRKLSPPSEQFWLVGDHAVFWAIDKTVVVPLAADAKAKSIKGPTHELDVAIVPEPDRLFGVADRSVVRFDGDRWTAVEGAADVPDAQVVVARLDGVYARALGGPLDGWRQIRKHRAVRATISASGTRCLIGVHGGEHAVIDVDGSNPRPVALGSIWGSIGFERGFFAWSDHRLFGVSFDGAVQDTGLVEDVEAADTCLFRAGSTVYFVQGSTIHRYRDGAWTAHDMAAAGAAIGLR